MPSLRNFILKFDSGFVRFAVGCVFLAFFAASCSELEKPVAEPYYAESPPPPKQELRWSNGKMPKSFDPAQAAAPPETDIVRAIFEGLTESDPKTLAPVPAAAEKWSADEEKKIWTFHLRRNAKWSNGEPVTAADFVRSWKRLAERAGQLPHPNLILNISGVELPEVKKDDNSTSPETLDLIPRPAVPDSPIFNDPKIASTPKSEVKPAVKETRKVSPENAEMADAKPTEKELEFGVVAENDFLLTVKLKKPDKDFPSLVSHPIFRPIHSKAEFTDDKLDANIVTNGAFRVSSVGADGVTVDKSDKYWNRDKIKLERVRFIPKQSAEEALKAYRAGELDAVTNAEFEPLALKLLKPYDDFQTTVHSALNFYEFNEKKKPFEDRKVREALAIAIERERLTDDEMDGSTKPALGFQPPTNEEPGKIKQDVEKARNLLSESGFPAGENFPPIRLLINRNNVQQRIARSVAKMWKENLNIETQIIVMESAQIDEAVARGDYDIYRRGVVLPTSDETVNMLAIFSSKPGSVSPEAKVDSSPADPKSSPNAKRSAALASNNSGESSSPGTNAAKTAEPNGEAVEEKKVILTEEEAIENLLAIPLYFPTSYSLVKPYVIGFEINSLDASSLLEVSIDNYWQPSRREKES